MTRVRIVGGGLVVLASLVCGPGDLATRADDKGTAGELTTVWIWTCDARRTSGEVQETMTVTRNVLVVVTFW